MRWPRPPRTEERAKHAPLSATDLAARYADYEPNVGAARTSGLEKLRQDAARNVWTAFVMAHNKAVADGSAPVLPKAVTPEGKARMVGLPKNKEAWDAFIPGLLAAPAYAEAIQTELDSLIAKRDAEKAKPKADEVMVATCSDLL